MIDQQWRPVRVRIVGPGESAGYGYAVGDFAVAYVVAHEYAPTSSTSSGSSTPA